MIPEPLGEAAADLALERGEVSIAEEASISDLRPGRLGRWGCTLAPDEGDTESALELG